MGRRKLEIKPIEDKKRRLVTFSKRRAGLKNKARQLSVLCDVAVAVAVFSSRGKLYEYCSGSTDSVELILSRYQTEERTTQEGACTDMISKEELGLNNQCTRFQTCKELLQTVRRVNEEGNEVSVTDIINLEEQLNVALMHTRSRKTQLMMERISTFHEQERRLTQEKEELKQELGYAAKHKDEDEVEDSAGNINCHTSPPQQLLTLPLFKD